LFQELGPHRDKLTDLSEKFKFSESAARFWAIHARQLRRNIEISTQILETVKSNRWWEIFEHLRQRHPYISRQSLLHLSRID
jgi:hypothetical protein